MQCIFTYTALSSVDGITMFTNSISLQISFFPLNKENNFTLSISDKSHVKIIPILHVCLKRPYMSTKKSFETQQWSFIRYELTDMSKISSESSSNRTLMGTRRPGGIAGGLCPGSRVLIPRVSGAPNLCPANDVWPCSTMVFLAQPAHNTHTSHSD